MIMTMKIMMMIDDYGKVIMKLMITDKEIKGTFIQSPCMLNGPEHIRHVHEELQVIRFKLK